MEIPICFNWCQYELTWGITLLQGLALCGGNAHSHEFHTYWKAWSTSSTWRTWKSLVTLKVVTVIVNACYGLLLGLVLANDHRSFLCYHTKCTVGSPPCFATRGSSYFMQLDFYPRLFRLVHSFTRKLWFSVVGIILTPSFRMFIEQRKPGKSVT